MKKTEIDAAMDAACSANTLAMDEELRAMTHAQAIELSYDRRLRWFYLSQVMHKNLARVHQCLTELLEPTNEVSIVSMIGMTGIGKTTLAQNVVPHLIKMYGAVPENEVPVIYLKVPSNGERQVSWKAMFRRIATEANDRLSQFVLDTTQSGEMRYTLRTSRSLWNLREILEPLLVNRNVKVLILDEAAHLIRFQDYASIMDTLKSLSDIGNVKLLLIGSYDIAKLVSSYGQVVRRGEIVHYRRYECGTKPSEGQQLTEDQKDFKKLLGSFQALWPSHNVPNLEAGWYEWMRQSLGSVGLLKLALLRLAALQLKTKGEKFNVSMLKKVFKTPKALQQLETEASEGEEELKGMCYGDCSLDDDDLNAMLATLTQPKEHHATTAVA